jgi:putative SOS response-associated peptidase YedK
MCGRFVVTKNVAGLLPGLIDPDWTLPDNWNVAPTRNVPVVRTSRAGVRELASVRWGFVPSWYDSMKQRPQPINARLETIGTSGMFRNSLARHRAVIPATGYYEWAVLEDGSKQPHFIYEPDGALAMAGILSFRPDKTKPDTDPDYWQVSMAIITRDAHVVQGPEVHDRMPALLHESDYDQWLDPKADVAGLVPLLDESSSLVSGLLQEYEVSKEANSVEHNGPELIEPLG